METIKNSKITLGTAAVVLIVIIGAVINYSDRLKDIEAETKNCREHWTQNENNINDLESQTREREMQYIEIKTKLEGIEATLLEIKQSIDKY